MVLISSARLLKRFIGLGVPLVGRELRAADHGTELGEEPIALQHHQGDEATVLGPVVADQRVGCVGVR